MFYFPIYMGNVIIPIDALIFFRGVEINHQAVDIAKIAMWDVAVYQTCCRSSLK